MVWAIHLKEKRVLEKLKKDGSHVAFLQETHLPKKEQAKFKFPRYSTFFNSTCSNSRQRGVTPLISNLLNFDFLDEVGDKEGRYLIVKGRVNNIVITLANVYIPPECDRKFFKSFFDALIRVGEGILFCGGDWNTILNFSLDMTGCKRQKTYSSKDINILMKETGLFDVWRALHPKNRDYTHCSFSHQVHSRLDFFLMNDVDRHDEWSIGTSDLSDHNMIYLSVQLSSFAKSTIWRLNLGILNKESTIKELKGEITSCTGDNNDGQVKPIVVWDTVKAVMRGRLISRVAHLKKAKRAAYDDLEKDLRNLEIKLQQNGKDQSLVNQIRVTKNKIKVLVQDELEKRLTFCKQSFYESSPKATKILARRLRKQELNHAVLGIRDLSNGNLIYDPVEIHTIFNDYYQSLYSCPAPIAENVIIQNLSSLDLPSLGLLQNEALCTHITREQLDTAISNLKANKCPGSDGFPNEWYEIFKEELAPT